MKVILTTKLFCIYSFCVCLLVSTPVVFTCVVTARALLWSHFMYPVVYVAHATRPLYDHACRAKLRRLTPVTF